MSKKTLLISLAALAIAAALIVGATLAFFTDTSTETIAATAGTVRIDEPAVLDKTVTIFNPGDVFPIAGDLTYQGNKSAMIRMRIEIAITSEEDAFGVDIGSTLAYLETALSAYADEADAIDSVVADKIDLTLMGAAEMTERGYAADDLVAKSAWLYLPVMAGNSNIASYEPEGTANDDLAIAGMFAKFNDATPNLYQGMSFKFSYVLEAAQFRNNGGVTAPTQAVLAAAAGADTEAKLNTYWASVVTDVDALDPATPADLAVLESYFVSVANAA